MPCCIEAAFSLYDKNARSAIKQSYPLIFAPLKRVARWMGKLQHYFSDTVSSSFRIFLLTRLI
jgi:hypothetical protein